jgi:hypothetical protein
MDKCYKTSNLQLAAYLKTVKDVSFEGIKSAKSDKQKIVFLFSPHSRANIESNNFYAGTATASAYELFQSFTALKDMIFESVRQEEL